MDINSIFSITKKEIMDNVRNKWVIILTIIFASLTLVVSYFGSYLSQGWQDLGITIAGMMSLVQFLIPIIGLMLGYATIIGEIERGSMSSLISLPATRMDILLGKFFGLGGILSLTILIGFGIAGIVIALNVSDVDFVGYGIFIGATILLGLVFLSLAMFFSTLFKKRSTAMGAAIFLWFFFNMILPLIFAGVLIAGVGIDELITGILPDWYYGLQLINPLSAYSGLVSVNVEAVGNMVIEGVDISYPSFYTSWLMLLIIAIWIFGCLFLAFWRFKEKDI